MKGVLKRGLMTLWGMVMTVTWAAAQGVQVEAPVLRHQPDSNSYIFEDARLRAGLWTVFASRLTMDEARSHAEAEGVVLFRYGSLEGSASRIRLEFSPLQGELEAVAIYDKKDGLRVTAERALLKADGSLELQRCALTHCPPPLPAWRVKAGRVKISPDGFIHSNNSRMELFNIPVAWFPWIDFPPSDQRLSGFLTPEIENQESTDERLELGWRMRLPYFQTLGPSQDITLTPEWLQHDRQGLGLEYRYAWWQEQEGKLQGQRYEGEFLRQWMNFEHTQGWNQRNRLTLAYADSSDGLVRRQYGGQSGSRPRQAWQAGFSQQRDWLDWSVAGRHQSEFREESINARTLADSNAREKARLVPRIILAGSKQWSPFPRGQLQFSWKGGQTRFAAEEALSGRITELTPQLELAQAMGSLHALLSTQRHLVRYTDLAQYQSSSATAEQLGDARFHQDSAQGLFRFPLARRFFDLANTDARTTAETRLLHQFIPAIGFKWKEQVSKPVNDPLITEQEQQRIYHLELENRWSWSSGKSARLSFFQRYDDLRHQTIEEVNPDRPQEGTFNKPMLPLITKLDLQLQGISFNAHARHDHQRNDTSQAGFSANFSRLPALNEHTNFSLAWNFNRRRYLDEQLLWQPEMNQLQMSIQLPLTRFLTGGSHATLALDSHRRPLQRRLQKSGAFLQFSPACYQLRITTVEEVVSSQRSGETEYILDRKTSIALRLSGW